MARSRKGHDAQRPVVPGSLPQLTANAAGMDVGGTSHFVAVPADRDGTPVREFSTFTGDLYRLADWLTTHPLTKSLCCLKSYGSLALLVQYSERLH